MDIKECIICREPKTDFLPEHVFPASLGGGFVINSVCHDCNQRMGKYIDTPFANHKWILLYRNLYGLSRGTREIKSPFTGKHTDVRGKEFIVTTKNREIRAEYLPHFDIVETEKGPVGLVTMSANSFLEDKAVKKYSKIVEERLGVPVSHYAIERTVPDAVEIEVRDENNKILMGCIKIGYETAVSCIPEYYLDNLAISYSKMLKDCSIDKSLVEFINPPITLKQKIHSELNRYSAISNSVCFTCILNVSGYGLVAAIKFFGIFYCFILSKSEKYIDERLLVLLNDPFREKCYPFFIKRPAEYAFTFESNEFSERHLEELRACANDAKKAFLNEEGLIPLYNKEAKVIGAHVDVLLTTTIGSFQTSNIEMISKIDNIEIGGIENVFLKSEKTTLLYPLLAIKFVF